MCVDMKNKGNLSIGAKRLKIMKRQRDKYSDCPKTYLQTGGTEKLKESLQVGEVRR